LRITVVTVGHKVVHKFIINNTKTRQDWAIDLGEIENFR